MRRIARNLYSKTTLPRLVRIALRHWESDAGWRAIAAIQLRASPATLEMAAALTRSPNWRRRALGLYIVSQLRTGNAPHEEYALDESKNLLVAGLRDPHPGVVRAAVSGLGHRPYAPALDRLVALAHDPSSVMRWNVAVALGRYEEPAATGALLRLCSDPDDDVRDWATFGLGSMRESDSSEIREALWKNLGDSNVDVRGEALVGLAQRRDDRLVGYLLPRLSSDSRVYELLAAENLANAELLDALVKIEVAATRDAAVNEYWLGCLRDAIAACRPSNQSE